MPEWLGYTQLLETGAWITLQLTVMGVALALVIAFIAGLARLSRFRVVRYATGVYVEFFRGTSVIVQMFWLFFALPLVGVQLEPMMVGVLALGLNIGSYGAEVVRGAVLGVPRDQIEAAVALNLTRWQRMRYVVLPQALIAMLPPFGNLAIELMKQSSLVSLITIADLTFQAQVFRNATGLTLVPFGLILLIYFVFATAIAYGVSWYERRASTGMEIGKQASARP